MSIIKADPVKDHVGWVNEAHGILEQSDTVTAHSAIVENADRESSLQQKIRQEAQDAVKEIKAEWVQLLEDLERLKQSLDEARDALEFTQKESDLKKAQYFNWVTAQSNLQYRDGAKLVVTLISILPILKERAAYKERLLAEHVKKMHAFGKEHGIEPETLKQLSGGG